MILTLRAMWSGGCVTSAIDSPKRTCFSETQRPMMRHPLHAVTVVITMTARHSVSQEHRVSRGAALIKRVEEHVWSRIARFP